MVKLPLEINPWLQAYQMRNFELGILQEKTPWVFNKYINCYYAPYADDLFNYVMSEGNYFERENVILVQKFRFDRNIFTLDLINFLSWAKEFIDKHWYIIGYFDEYYVKAKACYKKYHFRHSMLVYGYDDEQQIFYAVGYTADRNYDSFTLTYDEFIYAVHSEFDRNNERYRKKKIDNIDFDAIKLNENYNFIFNIQEVYGSICDYLNSTNSNLKTKNGFTYGVNCERYFINYIENFSEKTSVKLDERYSRFFMELKDIMVKRLIYMESMSYISAGLSEQYKVIAERQKSIHLLFIKYNLTRQKEILERMVIIMKNIIDSEIVVLIKIQSDIYNYLTRIAQKEYC